MFFVSHYLGVQSRETMVQHGEWRSRLEELDADQRVLIEGGYLSRRFSSLSLTTSHPSFISAFYSLLLSLVLILPLGYSAMWRIDQWLFGWLLYSVVLILMLSLLGGLSLQMARITGRMPVSVPRVVLFTAPFIGLMILTLAIRLGSEAPFGMGDLGLLMMVIPGPIYVHLSWAPRWRLLEMLESGENPFKVPATRPEAELINEHELLEVVDIVSSEE